MQHDTCPTIFHTQEIFIQYRVFPISTLNILVNYVHVRHANTHPLLVENFSLLAHVGVKSEPYSYIALRVCTVAVASSDK